MIYGDFEFHSLPAACASADFLITAAKSQASVFPTRNANFSFHTESIFASVSAKNLIYARILTTPDFYVLNMLYI